MKYPLSTELAIWAASVGFDDLPADVVEATKLRVLDVIARTGQPLAELIADLKVFPQEIKNVKVREKLPLEQLPAVMDAIRAAERDLDGNGRVVVRYSGTEALARVMVEAESEEKMNALTDGIAGAIKQFLGT